MPFNISVNTDLQKLVTWAHAMRADQLPFATAQALNAVAHDAADALVRKQPQVLDRPTPFTQRAWSVLRARKGSLTATVFAKAAQAKYLQWQVAGGTRQPDRRALKLPGAIKLDGHGNIGRADLARLVAAAKAGKRVTRKRGQKLGVSSALDLFYGEPGDGRPAGIYKRVLQGERQMLVPLVVFPARAARYQVRLPLHGIVTDAVRANFAARFNQAWAAALSTAR